MSIRSVNDFVVRFANVNGSGSASANQMFARAVLRMGVPVATRNIFPSNIQGLPTWFEVRVTGEGWLGARGGADLVVAMNPQTFDKDVAAIEPGGYLFYDNSRNAPAAFSRPDITVIGMPLTQICNAQYTDSRQRQLMKNIIALGALSALLDMDGAVIEQLLAEQFASKEKLIAANHQALKLGRDWAQAHLSCPLGIRIKHADGVGDRIFVEGNNAAALGAVYGGANVCAWYPLTPSTSLVEAFASYCGKHRIDTQTGRKKFAIIQAEDELASIGMVVGAGWNGARAFTATSGPGISLMQEFLGLAYFAEIPAVIFNVQRGGPSTGMPTRTQQSDILACAYASHGDTKHVMVFPCDPGESFEFGALAFDLADRLQTPIFVMLDLDIGMNHALTRPFACDQTKTLDRGKVLNAQDLDSGRPFGRYLDVDGDGIPYRTYPGEHPSRGAYFTRGSSHDAYARYTEDSALYAENMDRLVKKFATAARLTPAPVLRKADKPTRIGVIHYGSTAAPMEEGAHLLACAGLAVDCLRLRSFPFCDQVKEFIDGHDVVYVVEQNRDAQMRMLLINELGVESAKMAPVLHYDGAPITARFIVDALTKKIAALKAGKKLAVEEQA